MSDAVRANGWRIGRGGVLVGLTAVAVGFALAAGPQRPERSEPGLRGLKPTERFDTLFGRAMRASQLGDGDGVGPLAAQALTAFRLIRNPDADRRFHAGMLALHVRDFARAGELADAILAERPGHLLGLLLRINVASRAGDDALVDSLATAFVAGHRDELAVPLPEYQNHRSAIERYLADRSGAVPRGHGDFQ